MLFREASSILFTLLRGLMLATFSGLSEQRRSNNFTDSLFYYIHFEETQERERLGNCVIVMYGVYN